MKFILNDDILTIQEPECKNSGSIKYYLTDVEKNSAWEGLFIEARLVPKEGSKCNSQGRGISVIDNKLYIDNSLSGYFAIGFVGFNLGYELTKDTHIIEGKKYYTKNEDTYTEVEHPVQPDIETYYEQVKTYQISTNLESIWFNKGAGEIEVANDNVPSISEWEIYIAQIQAMIDNIGSDINYNNLQNKPQINNETLIGNKSLHDLGIQPEGNYYTKPNDGIPSTDMTSEVQALLGKANTALQENDNISKLNNNAGFITNAVDNLVNYYTKSETFTKQEVNDLISAITTLDLQVVQQLPTQDISTTTIYLVPKSTAQTNNAYDEYIYVSNSWEFIGSTEVDLTNYVTNTDYATSSKGGVFKTHTNYATDMANGFLVALPKTYSQYVELQNYAIISKGTLENVLTEKIGTIETILETLDVRKWGVVYEYKFKN